MKIDLLLIGFVMHCEYNFYGAPMGSVTLEMKAPGVPSDTADVALFSMPSKKAPVTALAPEAGEYLHAVLFKDDPQNELYLIINNSIEGSTYKSRLINPSSPPMTREIPGECQQK